VPVHGDVKDASQSSWIETSVPRNSLNLTDRKTFLNTTELKDLIRSYEENFAKFIEFAIKLSKNKGNNEQQVGTAFIVKLYKSMIRNFILTELFISKLDINI
jgi:hypothetical protein